MHTKELYLDANWNEVTDVDSAVSKLTIVTNDDGREIRRSRQVLGVRKTRQTYPTDPRAKAIIQGRGPHRMSNPQGH